MPIAFRSKVLKGSPNLIIGLLLFVGLYLTSLYSYTLFHIVAEIFSIVIAFSLFMIAWNTRRLAKNNYVLFLSIAFLFAGLIDFVHTLAYKGMGVFQGFDANLPTQLWIIARYLQSLSLLAAPWFIDRRLNVSAVFGFYLSVTLLLLAAAFSGTLFPDCFIEGKGLTSFKIVSEYVICLILIFSLALLLRRRETFDYRILQLIVWSILSTIVAELAFTFYVSVYGLSNLIGHCFKILSFYLVYRAIILTGLENPYRLLFYDLQKNREEIQTILDASPIMIFYKDRDNRFIRVNKALAKVTGLAREEIEGKSAFEIYPDQAASTWKDDKEVIVSGKPKIGIIEPIDTATGRRWVQTDKIPYLDKEGRAIGIIGFAFDITERKRMEGEERRNREEAERLAKEMAILAEIGKVVGSNLDINDVYESFAAEVRKLIPFDRLAVNLHSPGEEYVRVAYIFGEAISGRNKGDLFPLRGSVSEVLAKTRAGLYSYRAEGHETDQRFDNYTATIQEGLRSLMGVPLIYRDEVIGSLHFRSKTPNAFTENYLRLAERIGAQIAGAIGTAKLFSDLKNAENLLRESEGRFRGLVEQAAVGVAEIEMSTGRFFTVNRRLCEMVGRTEVELLATTFQAITHPEDLHLHEQKTRMMLAGEIDHYNLEKRYLRKDGGIVWVNITVSLLWKPGEAPGRNIAVVEDITDRKRMEEEILTLSITDPLTGLHNRRGFLSLAEQQLKLSDRNKRGVQLYFADLDGLKWINDTLGHEEGDKALIEAATVFKETFRTSDIIARLGGDEYAALAVDINEANTEIFTVRLQSLIDVRNNQEDRRYRLSISVGCSYYDPENPCRLDELMASADKLMYEHKQNKKGLLPQGASLSNSIQ